MKRKYESGTFDSIEFFIGREVEHTPAYGKMSLFVTGIQPLENIEYYLKNSPASIEHIFFGANHSYNPQNNLSHCDWESMIRHFLDQGYLCSLDIPINQAEEFNEGSLCEYNNFIPQIRVPLPYIKLWNYNTVLKIDDKDFQYSNPGVWSHSLHDLMQRNQFTNWQDYTNDKPLTNEDIR